VSNGTRKLVALAKRGAKRAILRRTAPRAEQITIAERAHPEILPELPPQAVYSWRVQRPTRNGHASWRRLPRKMSDWRAAEYAAAYGLKIGRNMEKVEGSGELPSGAEEPN
jgi:hypothetical protein